MDGGDRTFRVNFTSEGAASLRERIHEKLKEYMGDYTDDTLVEYVIVLLKNGRRKDEAKSELDVFLGDDSESFVFWLWDHLGSSLNLYTQQPELHLEGASKKISPGTEQDGKPVSNKNESISEEGNKTTEKHKKQGSKDHINDQNENHIPESSVANNADFHDEPHPRVRHTKRSSSPHAIEKKRRRHEERRPMKSEISQTTVSAPRRILQFAVRDAVATSRPSNTTSEPSKKRLRSIVSTPVGVSFHEECSQRIRAEAGLHTGMSAAIKAVAEAVKDVTKARSTRSVFDRLGHDGDGSKGTNHVKEHRGVIEPEEAEDFSVEEEDIHLSYQRYNGDSLHQEVNLESFNDVPPYFGYDEGYDVDISGQPNTRPFQVPTSGGDWVESRMFQYDGSDERVQNLGRRASVPSKALKIASSTNTNVQRPHYQEVRKVSGLDSHNAIADVGVMAIKSQASLMKEKIDLKDSLNRHVKQNMRQQHHEPQKVESAAGVYFTGPPTEDADSRTIFVSNVHFAATKDSLSRHFNKFGEVLKVIILTDPSTGQPKGSAYIEFMRKEASEQALSLDGTSFMSRILKIVRKASAQPEMTSSVVWPRVARASPFAVPRLGRVPFGRGFPNPYRSHVHTKPGPRSFQWKRDTQPAVTDAPGQTSNIIALPALTRSLTYVRTGPKTEAKTNETSGTA